MDKKAAIGITLTWITAFLIIFFIMLLFLSVSGSLAVKKKVTFNSNEIIIENNPENMVMQRELFMFLNSQGISGKTIRQEIISLELAGDENVAKNTAKNIEGEAKKILEEKGRKRKCYLFEVKGDTKDYISINIDTNPKDINLNHFTASSVNLFLDNKKINIIWYTREC